MTERHRPIDPPRRVRLNQLRRGQIGGQGIEVVADHLRPDILACSQPSQAGSMLQTQAMLEALEGLLNAPAPVIKVGKGRRGIVRGIEQGSHEYTDLSLRRYLTDQADRRRLANARIIDGVLAIRRGQYRHGFFLAGSHELGDGRKGRRRVAAHAERNAPLEQDGDQPATGITAIKHQHVLAAQAVKALEQHLPFADQRAVQDQRIEQLDAWTKQAKQGGLVDTALSLAVEQGQANLGGIGGQHPQPQPERLSRNDLVHQTKQFGIERIEDIGKQMAARLRESTGGDHATQAGSPRQQGKKGIKFDLNRTPYAGKQEGDQVGKGQIALASEMLRLTPSRFEESGTLNKGCELGKYVDIFRPSYLTYKYQLVTGRIIARHDRFSVPAIKYAEVLSHEDCAPRDAAR